MSMHALDTDAGDVSWDRPVEATVSAADLALIRRMEQTIAAAAAVQQFVNAHLAATYGLQPGDQIDGDGTIRRQGAEA